MKRILVYGLFFLLSGCGWSTSRTRIVSGPNGVRVRESGNCVGMNCGSGGGYAYGAGYGSWGMGPAAGQGLVPSWSRFEAIEAYRARNHWTRSPDGSSAPAEVRDPRFDRFMPYMRHMANTMCQNGTLTGDSCVSSEQESTSQPATPAPAPSRDAPRGATVQPGPECSEEEAPSGDNHENTTAEDLR